MSITLYLHLEIGSDPAGIYMYMYVRIGRKTLR
jgi:hypothetical protein